jgi:hypothetical protein
MFVHSPLGILAVVLVLCILFGGFGYGRLGYGAAPFGGPLAYGGGGILLIIIILLVLL